MNWMGLSGHAAGTELKEERTVKRHNPAITDILFIPGIESSNSWMVRPGDRPPDNGTGYTTLMGKINDFSPRSFIDREKFLLLILWVISLNGIEYNPC
jgi:hypothetical protein